MTKNQKLLTRFWYLVVSLYYHLLPVIVSLSCADGTLDSNPVNTTREEKINRDTLVINILSAVKGQPKRLSSTEVNKLRQDTPGVVERFVKLINQDKLLDDVISGNLDKSTFDDLARSLIFLETAKCSLSETGPVQTCLVLRHPISFPDEPVTEARLSAFIEQKAVACDIYLKLYSLSSAANQFKDDVFYLHTSGSEPNLGPLTRRARSKREVTWGITGPTADLKTYLNEVTYPVIMTLECASARDDTPRNMPHVKEILTPDRQAVIQLLTAKTQQMKATYNPRRLSSRSLGTEPSGRNLCPSFIDGARHLAMCCLFEYTLNKQQMDANPKLRFIIFPQHLPLNLCHGRCVGAHVDWRNSHVMLLNRYFEGLPQEERELLQDSMPCCAANQTAPFTIIYKNQDGQLTTETLPNAKKISCACG
ncbi:hypothetical protein FGIG_02008 [Fasciola gigantica]|uniref:TGF-beta family profile domain-containing protein n=1 Tax=Fasciola gigantica TaxID=46835 RepID=A0A504Y7Y2_FASGI|nr:hypothetical protein FGIG_02008 [Fasciola gigantica]